MKLREIFMAIVMLISSCAPPPKEYASDEALNVDLSVDSDAKIIAEEASLRFPSNAYAAGKSGYVEVSLMVSNKGRVSEVRILKEDPMGYGFGDAARDHAIRIDFKPAVLHGKCISQRFIRKYEFKLSLYQITKP